MHTWLAYTSCIHTAAPVSVWDHVGAVLCAVPVPPGEKCIIPECTRKRYTDSSMTHHYCSRSHADEGKKRGIFCESLFVVKQLKLHQSSYFQIYSTSPSYSLYTCVCLSVCLSVCSKYCRPQGPMWPAELHPPQGSGGQWVQVQPLLQGPCLEGWWGWDLHSCTHVQQARSRVHPNLVLGCPTGRSTCLQGLAHVVNCSGIVIEGWM